MKKRLRGVAVGVTLIAAAGLAQAAGFALYENNASGLGTAFAGQAAVAQDASTIFFNPAGLSKIEGRQLVGALTFINPSSEFSGSASSSNGGYTPPTATGGDAGVSAWVPAAFYAMDIRPDLKFGIGVYAPFGLATDYEGRWAGEVQALYSHMQTINLNPTLAWKMSGRVSMGLGVNWQQIEAELSSFNPLGGVEATMKGDDLSWGWNAGILIDLDEATRLGVSYRSKTKHELTGNLTTPIPTSAPIKADMALPDMASISLFRKMNPQWDLLADATWTGWSSFEELRVVNPSTGIPVSPPVEYAWEDAWRFTLGLQYHASEKWTWRAGVAFDQTPIPDARHRAPRVPDEDRISVAVGAQYRVSKQSKLDFGYMHIFFDDAAIDHTESIVTLTGTFDVAADILGAQLTYNF